MNVIIITNNRKDIVKLIKKYSTTNASFKLYSDNSQLHYEVSEICNLYSVKIDVNFYTNYEDIERIWDDYYIYSKKINEWIKNVNKHLNLPSSIFWWSVNNEGGYSTVIFSSLLTSKLMRNIIDIDGKTEVYIRNDNLEYKDSELILSALCRNKVDISVNFLEAFFPYYYKFFLLYLKAILSIVRNFIYMFIRKLLAPRPKPKLYDNFCAIHYVGASYNRMEGEFLHFEKIYAKGIPLVVLSENCSLLPLSYNTKNIKIQRLESWLKLSMIFKSIKLGFQSIKAILLNANQISQLIKEEEISFILKHYLLLSSINYYTSNLMSHLLLSEFIKHNNISMFRLPALTNQSGVIDIDVLKNSNKTQLFTGIIKHSSLKAYSGLQKQDIQMAVKSNALIFVDNKYKDFFISQGVKEKNLKVVNTQILSSYSLLKTNEPLPESILLKIKGNYRIKILLDACDPGSPHRSPQEHSEYMMAFLKLAQENPQILLIVKPHSGNWREISESVVKNNLKDNIVLVDKQILGTSFFPYVDLLCSRSSTLIFEALASKLAILGVKLEGIVYDDWLETSVQYVYSVEKLRGIINQLVIDQNYCDEWLKNIVKIQNKKLRIGKLTEGNKFVETDEVMVNSLENQYFK